MNGVNSNRLYRADGGLLSAHLLFMCTCDTIKMKTVKVRAEDYGKVRITADDIMAGRLQGWTQWKTGTGNEIFHRLFV